MKISSKVNPDFDREKYFRLINEIMSNVRKQNIRYSRIFSEPRKSSGYRTKLWNVYVPQFAEFEKIVSKISKGLLVVECKTDPTIGVFSYRQLYRDSFIITPKSVNTFSK